MRIEAMLPLRGLQTLPSSRLERSDTPGGVEAGATGSSRSVPGDADTGVVVGISAAAASLLEGGPASGSPATAPAPPQGSAPDAPPFEPEIFGDDADEQVEDASRIGLNASADDLGGSDIERYGAAEDFGKDGVFQIYGAEPERVADDRPDPAEEARQARIDEATPGGELTPDEQEVVNELRVRDAEVRSHEAAHMAAGGGLTGGMSLSYQVGPDGKRYAVGGEVSIDASPGSSPEETVLKAQRIRAAALAPAEPSAQDRAVAARAGQMESDARAQLRVENANELRESLSGLQPGEEADGIPPETVTLGEVDGLGLGSSETRPSPAVDADIAIDPDVEAALAARGEAVDLMAVFEKVTGSTAESSEEDDEASSRIGGRLSGFESGTAADAQLMGAGASLEDALRMLQGSGSDALALVA